MTLKVGSNQALRFCVVESCKNRYVEAAGVDGERRTKVPTALVGAYGVLAGVVSVLCNNPLDVVKTRMQGLQAHRYRSTAHCFYHMCHDEGLAAFYKGIKPRMGRACLEAAITFTIYETVMDYYVTLYH